MRVVIRGTDPLDVERLLCCGNCHSVLGVFLSDARRTSDRLASESLLFTCPVCDRTVSIATKAFSNLDVAEKPEKFQGKD